MLVPMVEKVVDNAKAFDQIAQRCGVTGRVAVGRRELGNATIQAIRNSGDLNAQIERHLEIEVPFPQASPEELEEARQFVTAVAAQFRTRVSGTMHVKIAPKKSPDEVIAAFIKEASTDPPMYESPSLKDTKEVAHLGETMPAVQTPIPEKPKQDTSKAAALLLDKMQRRKRE